MKGRRGFGLALLLAGCAGGRQPAPPPAYVLGPAWLGEKGVWFYPQEQSDLQQTGLSAVARDDHTRLTADHEVFDQSALAAGHQTLQMPSVLRVTNLENGRAILVRVNDRGPTDPGRVIELTRHAAELLGIPPTGGTQVRLDLQELESRALAERLAPQSAPPIQAVPRGEVQETRLDPPPGFTASLLVRSAAAEGRGPPGSVLPALPEVPDRLPEKVMQGAADPGGLMLDAGEFSKLSFAEERLRRLGGARAHIERTRSGRIETFRVLSGPYATPEQADHALDQAIAAGVPDARIVVE
jgi:rare lipoprotein A